MKQEVLYWDLVGKREAMLTPEEHTIARELLYAAREACPIPEQSSFEVRSAVLAQDGDIAVGGNMEFAFSDAFIHGETAALANLYSRKGKVPIRALAFYSLYEAPTKEKLMNEKPVGGSCGNCRDVFDYYGNDDMLVVEGNPEAHVSVTRWRDYRFENFTPVDPKDLSDQGVGEAAQNIHYGVTEFLPDHVKKGVYGVALVSDSGNVWGGSLYTNAGYDAVTPGLVAVQVYRHAHPDPDVKKIVIASYNDLPSPLYRDRQALTELAEVAFAGGRKDGGVIPVELLHLSPQGGIVAASKTNTDEWMPIPFTAGSFGMDTTIKQTAQKLYRKR